MVAPVKKMVRRLREKGVTLDVVNHRHTTLEGNTLINLAARCGCVRVMRYLVSRRWGRRREGEEKRGGGRILPMAVVLKQPFFHHLLPPPPPTTTTTTSSTTTYYYYYYHYYHHHQVKEEGARIDIPDVGGFIPLMNCSWRGHLKAVKFLLSLPQCDLALMGMEGEW